MPHLRPGYYRLQAEKPDFERVSLFDLQISVTETLRVELFFHVAKRIEHVEVYFDPALVQPGSSTLGGVLNQAAVSGLPLVTRNGYFNPAFFATQQIVGADGIGTAFGNSPTGVVFPNRLIQP